MMIACKFTKSTVNAILNIEKECSLIDPFLQHSIGHSGGASPRCSGNYPIVPPVTFCLDAKSNQKDQDLDLFAKK